MGCSKRGGSRNLGVPAEEIVMIGDIPYDAEGTLDARVSAFGVLMGG